MFIPEAELPVYVICYIPVFMSLLNILPSPKSFPFIIPYLLFENTISVTKFSAMLSGLFHFGNAYEWVVTKKSGRTSEFLNMFEENTDNEKTMKMKKKLNGIHKKELALALSLLLAHGVHFYFLLFQGLSFFVVGLGLIGEHWSVWKMSEFGFHVSLKLIFFFFLLESEHWIIPELSGQINSWLSLSTSLFLYYFSFYFLFFSVLDGMNSW